VRRKIRQIQDKTIIQSHYLPHCCCIFN